MDRMVDHLPELGELELTLRRIVAGARLVAAAWVAVLGVTALIDSSEDLPRPGVVFVAMVIVAAWALGGLFAFRVAPDTVSSRLAIGADAAVAGLSLMAPTLAGAPDVTFYGGLPLTVVAIAAVRGRRASWLMALTMVLSIATAVAIRQGGGLAVISVSQVITYAAGAFIFTWIVTVLRRADAERVAAQVSATRAEALSARAAERVEIARHLHDSVLQTLALIQRSTDRPAEVTSLARRQERELREWLYGPDKIEGRFDAALRQAAGEVESLHPITLEVVVVGDVELVDSTRTLVSAAKEAMVNVAKHAGVETAAVFAEVAGSTVRVFVRDRGRGFDPSSLPSDRHGIRQSIVARLEEIGGSAKLRTDPGWGSEWVLEVPT